MRAIIPEIPKVSGNSLKDLCSWPNQISQIVPQTLNLDTEHGKFWTPVAVSQSLRDLSHLHEDDIVLDEQHFVGHGGSARIPYCLLIVGIHREKCDPVGQMGRAPKFTWWSTHMLSTACSSGAQPSLTQTCCTITKATPRWPRTLLCTASGCLSPQWFLRNCVNSRAQLCQNKADVPFEFVTHFFL